MCYEYIHTPTHLLLDAVAALLGDVDEVQHAALQVGQRCDRLHFDRVPLLQRMIQDAWRINNLRRQNRDQPTDSSHPKSRMSWLSIRVFKSGVL